jgi:hypothetical protein
MGPLTETFRNTLNGSQAAVADGIRGARGRKSGQENPQAPAAHFCEGEMILLEIIKIKLQLVARKWRVAR